MSSDWYVCVAGALQTHVALAKSLKDAFDSFYVHEKASSPQPEFVLLRAITPI